MRGSFHNILPRHVEVGNTMVTFPYQRHLALEYARRWAYSRNPDYYNFDDIGGDCTNFASQCLYAGSGVMNFTPVFGWYYINVNNRAPSWTGVEYFYNFMTQNTGVGPVGVETDINGVLPGDFVQYGNEKRFYHTPIITEITGEPSPETILVAAHTNDAYNRPISTYEYEYIRFIHIVHINSLY